MTYGEKGKCRSFPIDDDRRLIEAVLKAAAGHQRTHHTQGQVETVGSQLQ